MIKLWNYFRSGTSHRVRIALNFKGVEWQYQPLNFLTQQHKEKAYLDLNPQGLAPAIEIDGAVLFQSPAIIEYLEERFPEPPLLPGDAISRAKVRAMAMLIGCDIHPLNNLRVLNEVKALTGQDAPPLDWIAHWVAEGFSALETLLSRDDSRHPDVCFGTTPGLVECYLIPQVYAANRFKVDMTPYPLIRQIDQACSKLAAFQKAHPDIQPDAPGK
ncbi:MAG: maleylacetoacetate isomerase [Robiginitomaculum sp.]|nr:MAG: maleylacetoacetate isomerase [Robiginitomaculum sp.]